MSPNVHYINEYDRTVTHRNLSSTVNETKEELKQFAATRIAMLQSELRENFQNLKFAAPILAGGALMAVASFLVLTGALVAMVWTAFAGSLYAPFLAFLIVGAFYAVLGFGALFYGYGQMKERGVLPERTIKVLKDDKVWLQNEARPQR